LAVGPPLSGHIRHVGTSNLPPAAVRIQLRPSANGVITNAVGLNLVQIPTTNDDGTFRIDSVNPGEYRVTAAAGLPLPPEYYMKEARYNQNDVLNKPPE